MIANHAMAEGFIPVGPGQHNVALTTAVGLTIPAGATRAVVQAAGAVVKYTTDGTTTPTGTVGMTLATGSTLLLVGAATMNTFKAFSATGTLDVEYFA